MVCSGNFSDPPSVRCTLSSTPGTTAIHLHELGASHLNRYVEVEVQVVGASSPQILHRKLVYVCEKCGWREVVEVNVDDPQGLALALFDTRKLKPPAGECSERGSHRWVGPIAFEDPVDFITFKVKTPPQVSAEAEVHLTAYLMAKWRPLDGRKLKLGGWVLSRPSKSIKIAGDIVIAALGYEPLSQSWANFKLSAEDVENLKSTFGSIKSYDDALMLVDKAYAPHIVKRAKPKLMAALTVLSPHKATIHEDEEEWVEDTLLRSFMFGDTKTAKTRLLLEAERLGADYVTAETSTRTGLLYTIDYEANPKVLVWGVIPLADREAVALDGLQALNVEEMGQLREALETGHVKVRRALSGDAPARTRILAALNPPRGRTMSDYTFMTDALLDLTPFRDPADLSRWHGCWPFKAGDVPPEDIVEAKMSNGSPERELLRKLVLWAWSLEPSQVHVAPETWAAVKRTAKTFMARYRGHPLVHDGYRHVVLRWACAWAVLTFSVDDRLNLNVKSWHVELAKRLLEDMLEALEAEAWLEFRQGKATTEEELEHLINELSKQPSLKEMLRAVEELELAPVSVLSFKLDLSERTIKEKAKALKGLGLITSGPKGYALTGKGKRVLKVLMERGGVLGQVHLTGGTPEKIPVQQHEVTAWLRNYLAQRPEGVRDIELYAELKRRFGLDPESVLQVVVDDPHIILEQRGPAWLFKLWGVTEV